LFCQKLTAGILTFFNFCLQTETLKFKDLNARNISFCRIRPDFFVSGISFTFLASILKKQPCIDFDKKSKWLQEFGSQFLLLKFAA